VELPANLRFLRILVTVLTATMILGLLVMILLIVIRVPGRGALILPDEIVLPEGAEAQAVTQGDGWFAVVTRDQRLLIYGADGTFRREIAITPD